MFINEKNFYSVLQLLGWVILGFSVSQVLPLSAALYYAEPIKPFLIPAIIGLFIGLPLQKMPLREDIHSREALVFVFLIWLIIPLLGIIPYLISGTFPTITDAFFESMSGFTTTGSTVLTDFSQPKSILLWRQFTQWIGGMGIIVLFIAILPRLSIAGRQIMEAEAPGPSLEKLTPRMRDTAKILWIMYIGLTGLEALLLMWSGLTPFDAVSHAFTTMPTGGFSPRAGGIIEFPLITRAIISVFIFLAGVNFALLCRAFPYSFKDFLKDSEFMFYAKFTGVSVAFTVVLAYLFVYRQPLEAIVNGAFQAVTIITSTGYASANFAEWPVVLQVLLFVFMFTGGSAGSTGGGIKMIRLLILFKVIGREIKQTIHPRAVLSINLNKKSVSSDVVRGITAFTVSYMVLFFIGTLLVAIISSLHGVDVSLVDSATATIATLGNIGPGLGKVGPLGNFAFLPGEIKWILSFLMMAGRLEVMTVLVIFTPNFWRNL